MKASEDLHQLIHSMNMSEKRYFKIHASLHIIGKQNNYIRLFDAIEKQDKYDENELKLKFKGDTFIKHLPSEKHYLYQQLLESLNAFSQNKTFLSRHNSILTSIEILYNRGLFFQCRKLIRKARAEAASLEKFSILYQIVHWETLLDIKDEDEKSLNKSLKEEQRILETMQYQSALMQIAFYIQIQIDKGQTSSVFIREQELELERLHTAALLERDSFWSGYYYYSGIALLATLQNDEKKRYECYKRIKEEMDAAPQFIRDLPAIYHLNSNNLVNVMFFLKKYKEASTLIDEQRSFLKSNEIQNPTLFKRVFLNTSESELYLCYRTGRYKDGVAFIKSIEAEVKKMENSFSPLLFDLLYMMAVIELLNGSLKNATKWLNRIQNAEQEVNIRMELQLNSRLIYLLVLFESSDILFENRLNSTKRFMGKVNSFPLQVKIFEAVRMVTDEKIKEKEVPALWKILGEIREESVLSNRQALNKQFDFADWVERHIAG
ncbi:MAG: hypothetical protein ACHQRM_17085 [Bacteroidia bacterium]